MPTEDNSSSKSLGGFHRFIKDVRSLWSLTFSGPVILPFIAAFLGIAPPWPKQIAPLTAIMVLIALILTYETKPEISQKQLQKRLSIGAAVLAVTLFIYLALINMFVFEIPTNGERVVLGCGYTDNAIAVSKMMGSTSGGSCPGDYENMLAGAQYNSYEIWRRESIMGMSLTLLLFWFSFFMMFSVFLGWFVISQHQRQGLVHRLKQKVQAGG